ncbi:hypothetical protein JX266_001978 [Neoarthrinium moseri]|nr:hypothetical protein JX266_001978 [Neoarthrinium moseri]
MGIPGLTRTLKPYAVDTTLRGKSVVVDGPALVHRVWETVMANQTRASVILGHISYQQLVQAVIDWLDRLRACGVHVRRIYFDGYLPPRKWETRRKRLVTQSQQMQQLTTHYRATGVKAAHVDPSSSFALHHPTSDAQALPKHAFLVPAAVEALMQSPDWKSVVRVVPGEADAFCADDVRQSGGIVLTADSDLLIEDLGPEGSVVFFWDLFEKSADGREDISAQEYTPRDIEARLDLDKSGGLSRLAFELGSNKISFNQAIEHAASKMFTNPAREMAYEKFLQDHMPEEYIPSDHPVVSVLSTLDPRISEVTIQSLNIQLSKSASVSAPDRTPRGPEHLSMFLPVLIEDHRRKSAWESSQTIRQLAYGLAQPPGQETHSTTIEYRTLLSELGGRRATIPAPEIMDEWCEQLVTTLDQIESHVTPPELRWLAFAVLQEIQASSSEDRYPLALNALKGAVQQPNKGKRASTYSWDIIHFTAVYQASLYSLRMLRQVMEARIALSLVKVSDTQQQLRRRLLGLPSIVEYPAVEDSIKLLRKFQESRCLSAICKVLGIPIDSFEIPPKQGSKADAEQHASRGNSGGKSTQARSTNPFDILDSI